jgi:hypothetical protein
MSSSHEWEEFSVRKGWQAVSSDIDKLAPALVKAQGAIEGAIKDRKNDHFKSKYADLSAVWEACKPALQANGLAVLQLPCKAPPGHIGLVTVVLHESGQSISETFFMPLRDASNPQAAGSALTYARRYALSAALGVCPEDDDGNGAAKAAAAPPPTKQAGPSPVDKPYWLEAWEAAKTEAQKKGVFMTLRNSACPEPDKTELLTMMSKVLKGNK